MTSDKNREELLRRMEEAFLAGHHCSEVVFVHIGACLIEDFDVGLMRLATGFGGGIAEEADVCGALAGGVMLIGYLHGRESLSQDQSRYWALAREYRRRFLAQLGSTSCMHFTQGSFNPENHRKCAGVVICAASILLDLLDLPLRDHAVDN